MAFETQSISRPEPIFWRHHITISTLQQDILGLIDLNHKSGIFKE
tara:strand:+ start:129 stop:263 length:135 start_codon:yes stop_codon:yes gene_type:complete